MKIKNILNVGFIPSRINKKIIIIKIHIIFQKEIKKYKNILILSRIFYKN